MTEYQEKVLANQTKRKTMTINSYQFKKILANENQKTVDKFLKRWNPDNKEFFDIDFEDFIKDCFKLFKTLTYICDKITKDHKFNKG